MTKAAVRKRFLGARLSLDNLEIHKKSKKLFKNFLQVDELASKKNALLYFPIKNEVETQNFFAFYLKLGANIFLPAFDGKSWGVSKFTSFDDLIEGPFGTVQPKGIHAEHPEIDLAIVPGLAFSKNGVRVGFGMGIYDLILSKHTAFVVGLCFDFQLVDSLIKEEHDVLVDMLITDKKMLGTTF